VVLLPLSASVMSNLRYIVMLGPEAKAKTIKIGLEAPRGQGLASRTTSL